MDGLFFYVVRYARFDLDNDAFLLLEFGVGS